MSNDIRIALLDAFNGLVEALSELEGRLILDEKAGYPGWLAWRENARHAAGAAAIRRLEYRESQEESRSDRCPGALGVSEETLACARRVNEWKSRVKKRVLEIRHPGGLGKEDVVNRVINEERGRAPAVVEALSQVGNARVHLVQTYRQIRVLEPMPTSISLTWSCGNRSIRKVDVEQGRAMVRRAKHLSDRVREQAQARLSAMPGNQELAVVKPVAPSVRANVVWKIDEETTRQMFDAALPLLYPARPGAPGVRHNELDDYPPNERERKKRLPRSGGRRLAKEPIVPALRLYAYARH